MRFLIKQLSNPINELLIATWCLSSNHNIDDLNDDELKKQFDAYKIEVLNILKDNRKGGC